MGNPSRPPKLWNNSDNRAGKNASKVLQMRLVERVKLTNVCQ
jgi:hypothetical protein